MIRISIRHLVQEMMAERASFLLTILAVAWSAFSIAMVLSIGEGLRQGLIRTSMNGNGKLMYLSGGYATKNHGSVVEGDSTKLQESDLALMRSLPVVEQAEATGMWDKALTYKNKRMWQRPLAVNPNYAQMTGIKVQAGGRWLNAKDSADRRKVVVLGYQAAVQLFNENTDWQFGVTEKLSIDPIGMAVKIGAMEFRIIGVLAPSSSNIEDGVLINYSAFVPYATWRHNNPKAAVHSININPKSHFDRKKIASTIKKRLLRKHGAHPQDSTYISFRDNLLEQKTTRQFLSRLQSFLGLIGLITLSVAGVGIANVMFATIKRCERDIAIRMAVGAKPSDIRVHYFMQSLITMFAGGFIGILITMGLIKSSHYIALSDNALFTDLGSPYPLLSLSVLTAVVLALAFVGIMAAWFPANKAASVMPLEALQSE